MCKRGSQVHKASVEIQTDLSSWQSGLAATRDIDSRVCSERVCALWYAAA